MEKQEINRIRNIFPCFNSIDSNELNYTQIVKADPETPHPIHEGHRLQHAAFLLSGSIRIFKISNSGREVTLYRVKPGEFCVLMMACILGETEYQASASIEEPSELLIMPVERYKEWLNNYKALREYAYQLFIHRMLAVSNLVDDIAFTPVDVRIAKILYRQTTEARNTIYATHEQLAIELGSAREVVSRILKEYEKMGILLLSRGKIQIKDRKALSEKLECM